MLRLLMEWVTRVRDSLRVDKVITYTLVIAEVPQCAVVKSDVSYIAGLFGEDAVTETAAELEHTRSLFLPSNLVLRGERSESAHPLSSRI